MNHRTESSGGVGAAVVRLAALWILVGASFKLFVGSPNDLPASVKDFAREFLGLRQMRTYQLAIAIEMSIALCALLRPRLVWPLVVAQIAVFCAVLTPLVLSSAKSCGCFGSKVSVPPWVMLAVDGAFLIAILAARPWRSRATRPHWVGGLAAATAIAWALPFVFGSPGTPPAPSAINSAATRPMPRMADWEPRDWIDKPLAQTPLAPFVDVDKWPGDATWVIYSPTCDDCASYLRRLKEQFDLDPKLYVFLQLPGDAGLPRKVDALPPGDEVVLPTQPTYLIKPPWSLEVVGRVVKSVHQPEDV